MQYARAFSGPSNGAQEVLERLELTIASISPMLPYVRHDSGERVPCDLNDRNKAPAS